jgi:hypothetical protein
MSGSWLACDDVEIVDDGDAAQVEQVLAGADLFQRFTDQRCARGQVNLLAGLRGSARARSGATKQSISCRYSRRCRKTPAASASRGAAPYAVMLPGRTQSAAARQRAVAAVASRKYGCISIFEWL